MKKTLVFGGLFLFLFAGFRPPAGMSKLPKADIDFHEPAPQVYSASVYEAPQQEDSSVQ